MLNVCDNKCGNNILMCVQKDKFIDKEKSLNLVRLSLTNAIDKLSVQFCMTNSWSSINTYSENLKIVGPSASWHGDCMYIPNNAYAGGSALNQVM